MSLQKKIKYNSNKDFIILAIYKHGFFYAKNLKEIGHISRLHGYSGKLVISFNSEDPSILKK